MITLGTLLEDVKERLSLVGGLDAQIYTDERIIQAARFRFNMIFRSYWLPEYTVEQEEYTLDGTTGMITGDLSTKILDWRDLHSVMYDSYDQPLPLAPMGVRDGNISALCIRRLATNAQKMFKVLPVDTDGTIAITYRTHPGRFEDEDDEIKVDDDLMINGVCMDILEDDGTNPGGVDKFKRFYQQAELLFRQNLHNQGMSVLPVNRTYPTRWR